MKVALIALSLALCVAAAPALAQPACKAQLAKVDTLGKIRWTGDGKLPARWAARCEGEGEPCSVQDDDGVSYGYLDGYLLNSALTVRPGGALPWGLTPAETPETAARKIGALVGETGRVEAAKDRYTVRVELRQCDAMWIEAEFGRDRKLRTVTLNSAP